MKKIKFNVSNKEYKIIRKIAQRAVRELKIRDRIDFEMDIVATHCNGCPLRLKEFMEADDFNFFHDIIGIQNNLNRKTGKLEGFFVPRFARINR